MKKHTKKMIAPVVITVLMVLYIAFFGAGLLFAEGVSPFVKVSAVVIPVALIGVSIFVLVERIKEIRSGEEDDLSNY